MAIHGRATRGLTEPPHSDADGAEPWVADGQTVEHMGSCLSRPDGVYRHLLSRLP